MESEGDEEARKLCRKNNEKRGRRKVTPGKAHAGSGGEIPSNAGKMYVNT